MNKYKCQNCGKEFFHKSKTRKFCSKECYNEYVASNGKKSFYTKPNLKVKVICEICGKVEYVAPSRAKKYHTCSVECRGQYASKIYNKKIEKKCPICGKIFWVKNSQKHRRICCSLDCSKTYRSLTKVGENNANYRGFIIENGVKSKYYKCYKEPYRRIVKDHFGLKNLLKGYDIHHKDCNPDNNEKQNLVVLPRNVHMLLHRWFGNILLSALHTGKISREDFYKLCSDEQKTLYENIIDLDITGQAVVKQGELLESPEEDNQQPSVYRNIIEGSTTNSRALTSKVEGSNADTSALPDDNIGDDIV